MRFHGSLTKKMLSRSAKSPAVTQKRMEQNSMKEQQTEKRRGTRSDKYLSPRLNKSSWSAGEGVLVGEAAMVLVKEIFQTFHARCCHPNSFCQPLSHIIYNVGRQSIDSVASADCYTVKDARGRRRQDRRGGGKKRGKGRKVSKDKCGDVKQNIFNTSSRRCFG